jgi:hypothetical protein
MVVVMMTVHCHRGGRQQKRKCSRSNQPEFRHDRSPFTADIGAFFSIPNKMRFRNIKRALAASEQNLNRTLDYRHGAPNSTLGRDVGPFERNEF